MSLKSSAPVRQLVLLGASNLTRGLSTSLGAASQLWAGPLDVLAAMGNGRSYGMHSSYLGRGLPGIVQCGLWRELERRPHAPLVALVTDIGNDVAYEAPVDQIVDWLATCLNRLAARDAKVILTALPLFGLERLSPAAFWFFRRLFFPGSRLSLAVAIERSQRLDAEVRRLAATHGARLIEPRPAWYGYDPIHIRLGSWREAWGAMLGAWEEPPPKGCFPPLSPRPRASLARWCYLATRAPERSSRFGWPRSHKQPCGRFGAESRLSLY